MFPPSFCVEMLKMKMLVAVKKYDSNQGENSSNIENKEEFGLCASGLRASAGNTVYHKQPIKVQHCSLGPAFPRYFAPLLRGAAQPSRSIPLVNKDCVGVHAHRFIRVSAVGPRAVFSIADVKMNPDRILNNIRMFLIASAICFHFCCKDDAVKLNRLEKRI